MIDTYNIASEQIYSEVDQFNIKPALYVSALGWDKNKYPRINELKDKIEVSREDIVELQNKLNGVLPKYLHLEDDNEIIISLIEDNVTSDFTCNFIAEKITKLYKELK